MKYLTGPTLTGSAIAMMCILSTACAQEPIRLSGVVERIDGQILILKTRYGAPVKLSLSDTPEFIATVKSSVEHIKPGIFVGSTGRQQPDGTQRVSQVYILPEFMRETAESLNAQAFTGQGNISSAGVEKVVAEPDRYLLTIKYKNADRQMVVSNDTPVMTFVAGEKTDIKPGVSLVVADAKKALRRAATSPAGDLRKRWVDSTSVTLTAALLAHGSLQDLDA